MKHKLVVEVYTDGCTQYEKIRIAYLKPERFANKERLVEDVRKEGIPCVEDTEHNDEFFGNEDMENNFYAVGQIADYDS
jgi:hypothetical protein